MLNLLLKLINCLLSGLTFFQQITAYLLQTHRQPNLSSTVTFFYSTGVKFQALRADVLLVFQVSFFYFLLITWSRVLSQSEPCFASHQTRWSGDLENQQDIRPEVQQHYFRRTLTSEGNFFKDIIFGLGSRALKDWIVGVLFLLRFSVLLLYIEV